jgi:hypothetical protein
MAPVLTTVLGDKSRVDRAWLRSGWSIPLRQTTLGLWLGSGKLSLCFLLLLPLHFFRVAVEEHVNHHIPAIRSARDRPTEPQHLPCEQPPNQTNRMASLVVRGDGNVNELERCIRVAKSNDGDVNIRCLADRLVVNARIGDDDKTGLFERAGDVVREGTGGETAGNGLCAGVGSEFEDCTVSVGASRDDTDVVGVLDGGDYTCGKDKLLPSLANVENMDACAHNNSRQRKWNLCMRGLNIILRAD